MRKEKLIKKYLFIFLYPISMIYRLLIFIRNLLFTNNLLNKKSLPCKVVSVGNISIGGSGKTPMVEYLSKHFQEKGKNVGIISRGYKRNSKETLIVTDGNIKPDSWEKFGDEPYLLAHNLNNVPIVVSKSKYEAGMLLINNFNTEIIIIDDGFQHRSLHRDLDIVLINSKDKYENHKLLPIGQLREPFDNINRSDLVILTKSNLYQNNTYLINKIEKMKLSYIFSKIIIDDNMITISGEKVKTSLINGENIYIMSALGDSKGFEETINKTGAIIKGHKRFSDHYNYNTKDIQKIEKNAIKSNAKFLITTEKDMVKIKNYNGKIPLCSLKIYFIVEQKDELESYLNKINKND